MIASLMMYARPELAAAHGRYWALIRDALAARGVMTPENLSNDAEEFAVWTAPDLVLSQTCGMPYRTRLAQKVTLIGTPDYGLRGCPPGYYQSVVVMRADDQRSYLHEFRDARFAYNQTCSQSGYAAAWTAAKAGKFWFSDRRASGGHQMSAKMVAENDADIAFIDAQTWRFIRRYDRFSDKLRAHMWTEPTPGLPYISAKGADAQVIFEAVSEAISELGAADRTELAINEFVAIPKAAYLAVDTPPDHGC